MFKLISAFFESLLERQIENERPQQTKVFKLSPNAPNGPISVQRTADDEITATDVNGLIVSIGASDWPEPITKKQLADGIPIFLNDELIGHLVQDHHGITRSNRTLDIKPLPGSQLLPNDLHFRKRSIGGNSLEDSEGNQVIHGLFNSTFAPSATDHLICLDAIVGLSLSDTISYEGYRN